MYNIDNKIKISKHIAYLLRHHPEEADLDMDEHGWVEVDDLIFGVNEYSPFYLDKNILADIVESDDKQRYAYSDDGNFIRASQGHSIPVDVQLEEAMPPDVLWHGTATRFVESINAEGLRPQSRLYVHLSGDPDTAVDVGCRHGTPFVYEVAAKAMHDDGYMFYLSRNGVWLTAEVPPEYLSEYRD